MSADVEASPPRPLQLLKQDQSESPGLDQSSSPLSPSRPIRNAVTEAVKSRVAAKFLQNQLQMVEGSADYERNSRKRVAKSQVVNEEISDETELAKSAPQTNVESRVLKKAVRKSSGDNKQQLLPSPNQNSLKIVSSHSPAPSDLSPRVQPDATKPRFPSSNPLHLPLNMDSDDATTRFNAAVLIQSLWRGWRTRNRDVQVRALIQELRAKRAEDHIRYLRAELDRVIQMNEQEKKLRNLQFEAIKYLWQEVKSLQKWRSEVTGIPVGGLNGKNGKVHHTPTSESQIRPERRSQEAKTCLELTHQLGQLQDTVSTLTSYVFQGCTTGTPSDDGIIVSANRQTSPGKNTHDHWECFDSTPAEPGSPKPGIPACPVDLRMRGLSETSLSLAWERADTDQADNVIGYRLYVNDLPKSMLSCANMKASIEGLDSTLTYKFYVRTVSTLGESCNSVTLFVRKPRSSDRLRATPEGKPPVSRSLYSTQERLPSDDSSTPPHTPKIMNSHQRTRPEQLQPSSPDSEDSNKENVLGEPSRSQRKNRSLERFNQIKVMPDRPDQIIRKPEETNSPGSTLDTQAAADAARAAAVAKRKDRGRSVSLSDAHSTESDEQNIDIMKKSSSSECVALSRLSIRSCSPSQSDSLPAKASSKETLLKVQQSITDKSQLQDNTDSDNRKPTVRRSSSLKTTPDRYRLSPTGGGQIARLRHSSGGSDRGSPVIQLGGDRDSSPENVDENATNESDSSRRSSGGRKVKVASDEGQSSGLRRSASLKAQGILPNRGDMAFGGDELSRTLPAEFSPQNVQPVIVKETSSGDRHEKTKLKSSGLLSKFKSKK